MVPIERRGRPSAEPIAGNEDPIRHTFVIEELEVSLELPANTARRVDFDAASGTYRFFCDVPGHDDMVGVLTVAG